VRRVLCQVLKGLSAISLAVQGMLIGVLLVEHRVSVLFYYYFLGVVLVLIYIVRDYKRRSKDEKTKGLLVQNCFFSLFVGAVWMPLGLYVASDKCQRHNSYLTR
jgi:hypothetical protein